MVVSAAKVKAVCTKSELELVRNSRNPQLRTLSLAEVKRSKERTRKLFDKWQQQGRKQSRSQARSKGTADDESNTKLKAEIFREALESFSERQAKLESQGGTSATKAAKRKPAKKKRAVAHRQSRAAVRGELADTGAAMNRGKPGKKTARKKSATKKTATKKTATKNANKPAKKKTRKPVVSAKTAAAVTSLPASASKSKAPKSATGKPTKKKQRRAKTVAKQARIAESGLTSRVRGHVSARGKRSQAQRDSAGRRS